MEINARKTSALGFAVGVVFYSLLLGGSARAENLMQVYQLSLQNDAAYQAAQFKFSAATELKTQAKAGLLPDVSFSAEKTHRNQDIRTSRDPVIGTGDTTYPIKELTLSITQPLFRYESWLRYKQSDLSVQQAETEFSVASQDLMLKVAEAYFAALAAKEKLDYTRVEKAAVKKHLEDAEQRAKTGMSRVTDVHDARARYALTESREIESENVLDDSYQALLAHTATSITNLSSLKDEIPLVNPEPANPDKWIETALAQNLALEASRQSLEVARQEIERQKAGHYPTLDLVASRNRYDQEGSLFGGGSEVETTDYVLRFNLPLYQGGGVQSKMREAFLIREKAVREVEEQRRQVMRDTRAAYRGVFSGIKKVEALKQSIFSQKSALEVKETGYKAGVNTLLEVLDAQRDLYYAQTDYSQARYDYLLSNLRLKHASGSLNVSDLEQVNQLFN